MKNADMPAMPFTRFPNEIAARQAASFGIEPPSPYTFGGLTKREMFAMAAMQGLMSSMDSSVVFHVWPQDMNNTLAKIAINHADALLAELEKPQCAE